MQSSGVFLFNGHGHKTYISCGGGSSSLTRDYVLSQPAGSLSNCRLVVYVACLTANGGVGGANLAQATLDRGAKTVIAFQESIGVTQSDTWLEGFCQALAGGSTVQAAGEYAVEYTSQKYDGKMAFTDTWLPFGDSNQRFQ